MIRKMQLNDIMTFIEATGRIDNIEIKSFSKYDLVKMTFIIEDEKIDEVYVRGEEQN